MKLWTIQPVDIYEKLLKEKVFHCDPHKSPLLQGDDGNFGAAYDWMAEQMRLRVGEPPQNVKYPIWGWYLLDGKNKKPDLRNYLFSNYTTREACIEIEIDSSLVLLNDDGAWYAILYNAYLGLADSDEGIEAEDAWFESMPPDEQESVKRKSWERIFEISPKFQSGWHTHDYVQATFWEMKLEWVTDVRFFGKKVFE